MITQYEEIEKIAKKYFKKAEGGHGWDHTERVVNLCLRIGKAEKAKVDILILSALLHDIARTEEFQSKGKICHAEKGAILARNILEKHNISNEQIEEIVHCIANHRFRGNKKPNSLEAKILFDADKLDSIGAIGVGRNFLVAGMIGAKLYNDNFNVKGSRTYTKGDTAYREFVLKLIHVKDRIFTTEGKRIALERHRFMAVFFERMKKEAEGKL